MHLKFDRDTSITYLVWLFGLEKTGDCFVRTYALCWCKCCIIKSKKFARQKAVIYDHQLGIKYFASLYSTESNKGMECGKCWSL